MGHLGIFASRFEVNSKSLEAFDEALRFFKDREEVKRTPEVSAMVDKLLDVIDPISELIRGNLSESTRISEHHVIDIMKARHHGDWQTYRTRILELQSRLSTPRFKLSQSDYRLLNDIANALDAECANLYRRMSEG